MHLPNPASSNGGGLNDQSNLNFADLLNNGTTTGQRWRLFLDRMALGLNDLQQSGVTVLFRPFHEMNGEWFFWGAQVVENIIDSLFFLALFFRIHKHSKMSGSICSII